jgi:hypothetical protein
VANVGVSAFDASNLRVVLSAEKGRSPVRQLLTLINQLDAIFNQLVSYLRKALLGNVDPFTIHHQRPVFITLPVVRLFTLQRPYLVEVQNVRLLYRNGNICGL